MKRMIIDTANVLFRVAAAHGKYNRAGSPEDQAGLAMHTALNVLNKYYKQFRPDQLAVTFEGGSNWRKEYTRSAQCKSQKVYKANRVKDPSMIPFFELINAFEQLARQHTSLVCLSNSVLEGDDLIGGYVQRFAPVGDEIIIVSGSIRVRDPAFPTLAISVMSYLPAVLCSTDVLNSIFHVLTSFCSSSIFANSVLMSAAASTISGLRTYSFIILLLSAIKC